MRTILSILFSFLSFACFAQATPVVVADICPGGCSSNPSNLVEMNGKVYFFATSPTAGRELHVYDGTGVSVVADIAPGLANGVPMPISFYGSRSTGLTLLNGKLYFAASDTSVYFSGTDTPGRSRRYLYSYDGVNPPQKLLVNGSRVPSISGSGGVFNGKLFFAYNDSSIRSQRAIYNPANNSLQVFHSTVPYYTSSHGSPFDIRQVGPYVYCTILHYGTGSPSFAASPTGIFFDETANSNNYFPTAVLPILSSPGAPTVGGDKVFVSGNRFFPHGIRGVVQRTHISSNPAGASSIVVDSLWDQNASAVGPGIRSSLALYNGGVWYPRPATITNVSTNLGLYKWDTSSMNVSLVAPLPAPVPTSISIFPMTTVASNILYMSYHSSASGPELFAYAGGSSVSQITDIDGTSAGLNPTELLSYNGNLLIAGTTSTSGTELYRITGNGLGLTDAQQTSTAILSPNPASTLLTITLPTPARYTLHILSITGQTLRSHTFQGSSTSVSVEDFAPGLYFARIADATSGAPAGTARFVKE